MRKLTQAVDYVTHNRVEDHMVDAEDVIEDDILIEGLIKRFEYTFELGWNVMQDYAKYLGNQNSAGSRGAIREAFQLQLISNGQVWMDMIKTRNLTSHTYHNETANDIFSKIVQNYYPAFIEFCDKMKELRKGEQKALL